jgi:hypothetical protein
LEYSVVKTEGEIKLPRSGLVQHSDIKRKLGLRAVSSCHRFDQNMLNNVLLLILIYLCPIYKTKFPFKLSFKQFLHEHPGFILMFITVQEDGKNLSLGWCGNVS